MPNHLQSLCVFVFVSAGESNVLLAKQKQEIADAKKKVQHCK